MFERMEQKIPAIGVRRFFIGQNVETHVGDK